MSGDLWLPGVCVSGLAFVFGLLCLFNGEHKAALCCAAVWLCVGIAVNLPTVEIPPIRLPGWIEPVVRFSLAAAICILSTQIALLLTVWVVLLRRKPVSRAGQMIAPAPHEPDQQPAVVDIDNTFRRAQFFEI